LRLRWFDYCQTHDRNAARTCLFFNISRQPFYRWWRLYNPQGLRILQHPSHRPHQRHRSIWRPQLV
jgi:hypothetical protein